MPAYTFADIKTRIADELNRSDLTSQIGLAVISAVEHYERERWWFEETIDTSVTTTAAQNYVTSSIISSMAIVDKVQITVGGSKYTLDPIPYDEWAVKAGSSTTPGQPAEYTYYQDRIYLYPTPGDTYTLTISGVQRLTTLSGTASNGFTNYAEELIRQRAKADIRCNLLEDESAKSQAAQMGAMGKTFLSGMEEAAYFNVARERDTRAMTGRLRASGW